MDKINLHAAGIDIGSKEHYVAVSPEACEKPVRQFKTFTKDLYELADWLRECGIKTVAMESTGVYWIPVFQILEKKGFEVLLVNAHHIKNVRGRKTDVLDCQWIQKLHSYGLLQGSFRPQDRICVLRSYQRQRESLVRTASQHILRMQKALTQMNVQLHHVLSDITGTTGMQIIQAIISGQRDPYQLAALKNYRVKNSLDTIAHALQGDWREEHLFSLKQEHELYLVYQEKITQCELAIQNALQALCPELSTDSRTPRTSKTDLKTSLIQITGVDLTAVPGLEINTILTLIAECGLDTERWPSSKHFASWLGLCPNNKITGGKIMARSTLKVKNRAALALRRAAYSLHRSKTALGAYFRRLKARLGPPKAITATAHKLALIFYNLLKTKKEFSDIGQDYYEQTHRLRVLKNLKIKAEQLGFTLVENPILTTAVS